MIWLLGFGWGAMAAVPIACASRRKTEASRVRTLSFRDAQPSHRAWAHRTGAVGRVLADVHCRLRSRADARVISAELPVLIDLLGVAIGAGCVPFTALREASMWAPPRSAPALHRVVRRCELGLSLSESLAALGEECAVFEPVVAVFRGVELGAPIADGLSRLAAAIRADVRRAAETRARAIPVRLLFPLVLLVLPAFAVLTVIPTLLGGFSRL